MARSDDFFTIRHGSAGPLTFSERYGKQITRFRVYHVRNPKTQYQAEQRMRWKSAMNFMSHTKEIVQNMFEGIPHDGRSLNHFMSLAGKKNNLGYVLGIEKDSYDFWPNAFKISDGSLNSNAGLIQDGILKVSGWTTGASSVLNFLLINTGISSGDVMTIVEIFNLDDSEITETTNPNKNLVLIDTIEIKNSSISDYQHARSAYDVFEVNLKTCEIICLHPGIHTTPIAGAIINHRAATSTAGEKFSPEYLSLAAIPVADRKAINERSLKTYLPQVRSQRSTMYLNGG